MSIQRSLLIAFLSVSIVSAVLMTLLAYTHSRTALRNEIRQNLEIQAVTVMRQIDTLLFERIENVYGWSRLDIIQDLKIGDVDKRVARFLNDLKQAYGGIYIDLFCAHQGKIIAASDAKMIGRQWQTTEQWLSVPLEKAVIQINRPVTDDKANRAELILHTTLHSAFDQTDLGRLYARFDWRNARHILDQVSTDSNNLALLVDANGQVLARSSNFDIDIATNITLQNWLPAQLKTQGTFTYNSQQAGLNKVLVGYALSQGSHGLPGLGWRVLVITPVVNAFAAVTQLLWTLLLLLLVFAVLAIVLARRIASLIAQPLQQLTALIHNVTDDLDTPLNQVQGHLEVVTLAQAFANMIKELRQSRLYLVRMTKLAAVGEMAAMLAHEIRNPLGILRSSTQLLGRQKKLDDRGREMVGFMLSECDRINHLVSSLLDSAKPRPPVYAQNNLNDVLVHVLALLANKIEKKQIQITTTIPDIPLYAACDREQMIQVLFNLLLNAVQILPELSRIEVVISIEGEQVVIEISDNGPGIPIEERGHVFEPFVSFRAGGMGLGLSVVYEIIQMHQGQITISDSVWFGACFRIVLPVQHKERLS